LDLTAETARARPREVVDAALHGLKRAPVTPSDIERLGLVTAAELQLEGGVSAPA